MNPHGAPIKGPRETCPLTPVNPAAEAAWAQARNKSAAMLRHLPYCRRDAAGDLSHAKLDACTSTSCRAPTH